MDEGEGLKLNDEAISSHSSFSDMPESPLSPRPRPQSGLVPEARPVVKTEEVLYLSAFDRNRSRSVPTRRRPNSVSVSAMREQSVDSGLEASSEVSLTSTDSCTSLQYSTLGVSAVCILEAVRSMLTNDRN